MGKAWSKAWARREQGREATRHILVPSGTPVVLDRASAEQTEPLLARIVDLQTLEDLGDQLLISPDGDWLRALWHSVGEEH